MEKKKDNKETAKGFIWAFAPFFRPYKKQVLLWFLIYGIYTIGGILTPIAVKIYFDQILPSGKLAAISVFGAAYAAYALVLHVFYFFGVRGTARIIESVVADLRVAVYEKLHRLTIRFFDRTLSGEIVNRVTNDTRQLLNLIGGELVNATLQISMALVSLTILLAWDWRLAAAVFLFLPAYILIFRRLLPRVHKAARNWRRREDRLWGNWGEKLTGISLIQAFSRERREALKHHVLGHSSADQWFRMVMLGTRMNVFGGVTTSISSHLAYSLGCLLVVRGELNLGELLSLSGLVWYVLGPVQTIFNLINTWQQSAVSSERILKIMREVEEVSAPGKVAVSRLRGEIRFDHVVFEYESRRPVLNDVSFVIEAGKKAALVGHTGSGKSTVINLLLGFYRPQRGSILLDGVSLADMQPMSLRRNVGVVPQSVVLFRDTLRANIAYGKPGAGETEIRRVVTAAQLDNYVSKLPKGLDTRIGGEEGVSPSEGEAQKIAIARAILTDPAIVVLDEATASLDSEEELSLQNAVNDLLKGRTGVIIAHRLSTIAESDQVIVLEGGRLVEMGNPAELKSRPDGVYARLYQDYYKAGAIDA